MEYAIVIVCLVAALLAMQVYLRRGMQGKLRQAADELGQQYDPRKTEGSSETQYSSTTKTTVRTLSEVQLGKDLDGDNKLEDDVFGTESESKLIESTSSQKGQEYVGEMDSSLY